MAERGLVRRTNSYDALRERSSPSSACRKSATLGLLLSSRPITGLLVTGFRFAGFWRSDTARAPSGLRMSLYASIGGLLCAAAIYRPARAQQARHLRPAADFFAATAHLPMSAFTNSANSCGVLLTGMDASFVRRVLMSGN